MKEMQITVLTGTFVRFEGLSPPTEHTSGYWRSWPTEVENRGIDDALSIMPPETFRFRFFDLQIPKDDFGTDSLKKGKLERCLGSHEMQNSSGFFYPNCIPLTTEQALELPRVLSSNKTGREVLVPTTHLSLPSDANYLAYRPGYQIVIGSDRRGHLLNPGDSIVSIRQWDTNEFRTLYITP